MVLQGEHDLEEGVGVVAVGAEFFDEFGSKGMSWWWWVSRAVSRVWVSSWR